MVYNKPNFNLDNKLFPLTFPQRLWLETAQKLIGCEKGRLNKKLDDKTKAFRDKLSLVASKKGGALCEDQKRAIDTLKSVVGLGYQENLNDVLLELKKQFAGIYCDYCGTNFDDMKAAATELCLANQAAHASALVEHILAADKHYRYYVAQALKKRIELYERHYARRVKTCSKNTTQTCKNKYSEELKKLRTRFDAVIGAKELAEQEKKLLDFLNKPLNSSAHKNKKNVDKVSAIDEFNAARLALVEVRKAKAEKENKLKPVPTSVGSEKTLDNIHVLTLSEEEKKKAISLAEKQNTQFDLAVWVREKVEGEAPEYVIVLERGFTAKEYKK